MSLRPRALVAGSLCLLAAGCARAVAPWDGAMDAASPTDAARPRALCDDAGVCAPRALAPLSGSTVTSARPVLRWVPVEGSAGTVVELCRTRSCGPADVVQSFEATGSSAAVPAELSHGVWFWRLRARGVPLASAAWQLRVGMRSAPVNTAWGADLDLDGDGLHDALVGAPGAGARGAVFVHVGGTSGPATTGVRIEAPAGAVMFGSAVASAGDVDGDGYTDALVAGVPAPGAGALWLLRGGPEFARSVPVEMVIPGGGSGRSPWPSAAAGDVDGDGYGDLVVAAVSAAGERRALLYPGSPAGPARDPVVLRALPMVAAAPDGSYGVTVASAGDADGDGLGDVLVGDPRYGLEDGRVYLHLGAASGPLRAVEIVAPITRGSFGAGAACAGDVDGDGRADLALGTPDAPLDRGAVFVFYGAPQGVRADMAMLAGRHDGRVVGRALGGAGDLDGDGFGDVVAVLQGGGARAARLAVYRGGATGVVTQPEVVAPPSEFEAPGSGFAAGFASSGDFDGDGRDDLLVTGTTASSAGGVVLVYRGGAALGAPVLRLTGGGARADRYGGALAMVPIGMMGGR